MSKAKNKAKRSAKKRIAAPADGFACARILATYLENLLKSKPLQGLIPSPMPGVAADQVHPFRQFEINHIEALKEFAFNPKAAWPPVYKG